MNTAEPLLRDDGHHCDRNVLVCGVPGVGPWRLITRRVLRGSVGFVKTTALALRYFDML